jgi:glycosyltransferase, MGT family
MARVLFVNTGSEGHINPTLGVVRELVSRGEEVVYFCVEAYRERIAMTGASVRTIDGQAFVRAFISGGRNYMLERINGLLLTADVVLPSVLEQIRGEHFDYVVHDSMFGCGRLLAQILKLPAISSCTSFAQTEESFNSLLESFYAEVPADIVKPIYDKYLSLTDRLKVNYDVEIRSPYEAFCNPAPLTIVYTIKELQPHGEAFDQSYKFVGPSLSARLTSGNFDFSAIQGKNLIYISLGTVFNQAVEFYRLCMEALGNSGYSVVMAIGDKVQGSELGEIPPNFIVGGYVPQTDVLQYAKLFITHGGMNSAHEGLYYGIPLIVIPQGADQPVIARQVAEVGAGVQLSMKGLTADLLREAVDHALSLPSYKKSASRIGESLRNSGGYSQAADEIMEFVR